MGSCLWNLCRRPRRRFSPPRCRLQTRLRWRWRPSDRVWPPLFPAGFGQGGLHWPKASCRKIWRPRERRVSHWVNYLFDKYCALRTSIRFLKHLHCAKGLTLNLFHTFGLTSDFIRFYFSQISFYTFLLWWETLNKFQLWSTEIRMWTQLKMLRTCGRVVGHKTCGHSGYSDFSPLPSWPRIEGGDPGGVSWTYWGWSSPRGFLYQTSCQSPRPPCVCWETSVRQGLWRKQKHTCCSPFVVKIQNLHLPVYLRCMSANLWCDIPSGVANADHHHPLPPEGRPVFVVPAVNARARKCVMSWRRKHVVYVLVFMKPSG